MPNHALKSVEYNGQDLKIIQVNSHHKDVFKHNIKLNLLPEKKILVWNDGDHRLLYGRLQGDTLQNVTLAYETKRDETIKGFAAIYAETQPQVKDSKCNQENFCPNGICLHVPMTTNTTNSPQKVKEVCISNSSDTSRCPQTMFYCSADDRCIFERWKCDAEEDCSDGEGKSISKSVLRFQPF